jgi:hypothetical protein
MTVQRGVLKRRNHLYSGKLPEEIVADVQYCAGPEQDHDLGLGRVALKIESVKAVNESSIPDGNYDFMPVTAGLFSIAMALPLKKSGDSWDWRGK